MTAQLESPGYAFDMGVDDDSGPAEGISQDDIRSFTSYAGQRRESLHVVGHLLMKLLRYHRGASDEIAGFGFEKAGCPDERLQFGRLGLGVITRPAVSPKETRGHLVHPLVGALGGNPLT